MNYFEESLKLHEEKQGKISITSKVKVETRDDLSLAYTPGVAEPCRKIHENQENVYKYTSKGNLVAVVTDGSAVLGLGDIGPMAGMPVMEGKSILFKEFADVDAFPILVDSNDVDEIVNTVRLIAPTFGGINLEDIGAPRCFEVEEKLKKVVDIPVFHDDQHGTAIVVLAGVINALKVVDKKLEDIKVVVNGAGAAGTAIAKLLLSSGVKNLIACDKVGILYRGMEKIDDAKDDLAEITNPDNIKGSLADALIGADVFVGVSAPGILKPEMVKAMNKDAIIFAMANPTPEIMPDEAKAAGARVIGTGRSDFPNQVNNVLAFPGIFRGALDVRAKEINEEMKLAAAYAIAGYIKDEDLSENNVIPSALDKNVATKVAEAIANAARESGVARK
ncbi:NAD(P)-dependent malic enzyme [Clostridium beijerinckii]|uniref:Malate dehydrogenase (Oxaloacetate-decarboxylating) n=1 Tax=Clostridium beijerinckii TaxID=1520 RepID=A0A9Q5GH19_CLOBE|nr:malic enzyme-like NAD(P)-binding protein [Clostridium beijerinckii]AQS06834.1 NAD-dependent malic enzyme [Clostridium beijerinckii]MBA2883330.1 malate dehydrogenase (oxaloacetate-decarboxylating) [Clostridium beijerinckii]MBA2898516.1 malate dehydrogenase (oxaloacetate-decarboxylating) [Clostridium beijerinckii]MBA2907917.1 malate dehydrogenase (oxaloacetate-decarboxylating) [Clostridium beijerinckii]MBA9013536.1 malate dehydrogenase (oxaloacetate-decarboxylating) [Clostridium beijerinckii]